MSTKTTKMTKTEAKELKSLTKAEFARLRTAVATRKRELMDTARENLMTENKTKLAAAAKEVAKLDARAKKLQKDGESVLEAIRETGVDLKSYGYYRRQQESIVAVTVEKELVPKEMDDKLETISRQLDQAAQMVYDRLSSQESELIRKLTLNTLESEEAIDFFENLPTIETLLPESAVTKLLKA